MTLTSASSSTLTNPTNAAATFSFTVPASFCGGGDILHGGFVALIFDHCIGLLVIAIARPGFGTVEPRAGR
jgi:acyl-coenzyme A thioesterase PaaI-like protein